MVACINNNVKLIKYLVEEHQVDVNNHLFNNKSLFFISKDETIIKYVIEHKTDIHQIEEVFLVKYLVEHKAEIIIVKKHL